MESHVTPTHMLQNTGAGTFFFFGLQRNNHIALFSLLLSSSIDDDGP
jgi:hypothetical protein